MRVKPSKEELWLANNPTKLKDYAGLNVAVHADKGIVASSTSFDYLIDMVIELNLLDDVLFTKIPSEADDGERD